MQTMPIQSAQPKPSTAAERENVVLGPGEGEAVWFLDNFITVKVRGQDGAPFGVLESVLPAGSSTPFHRHEDEDEACYVLEGELTVFCEGGRRVTACAGSYVHLPRGVAHGLRAETLVRTLVLSDANGFVEMIREAGMPAPRRELPRSIECAEPDFARLEAACKRRRITLLGPLP